MELTNDNVSTRVQRLNNVIFGEGGNIIGISPEFANTMTKESLLDAFLVLFKYCNREGVRNRSQLVTAFINKYKSSIEELNNLRVNIHDFKICDRIGSGSFGNVFVVVERSTGDVYAMKKIKKRLTTAIEAENERMILTNRSSPWITNLHYAFQNVDHLYLVMEYLPGGDLLHLMCEHSLFTEEQTRFYLAEITLAINSLHELGYAHRDIKPENILIDRQGHLKLADFGSVCVINKSDVESIIMSPVGTPDYIAPELLCSLNSSPKLGSNIYDGRCDYWSMGIIGYEFIFETTPFHDESSKDIYANILSRVEHDDTTKIVEFADNVNISNEYKSLIESLVTLPEKRLNFNHIRAHKFFQGIDWDNIRMQVPPIIPTVNNDLDTRNFDALSHHSSIMAAEGNDVASRVDYFNDYDLKFIGYSYTYIESPATHSEDSKTIQRLMNTNDHILEELRERTDEIVKLKEFIRSLELSVSESNLHSDDFLESKDEVAKLENLLAKQNVEIANYKAQIKSMEASLKIEKEMCAKKEGSIAEMLLANHQKYEDAKCANEARYEKRIAEKTAEIKKIVKKFQERDAEFAEKVEECTRLQEKIDNFCTLLEQCKAERQNNHDNFMKHIDEITRCNEQRLSNLRTKLNDEYEAKAKLQQEIKELRDKFNDSIANKQPLEKFYHNIEKETNQRLIREKNDLEQKLHENEKSMENMQQEMLRLENEVKNKGEKTINNSHSVTDFDIQNQKSPYETASGSLTDIRTVDENYMADLNTALANKYTQNDQILRLNNVVEKMEEMLKKFGEQFVPLRIGKAEGTSNDKELEILREQILLEKKAARTANSSLRKNQQLINDMNIEKHRLEQRLELNLKRVKKASDERDEAQRLCNIADKLRLQHEETIKKLNTEILELKEDVQKENENLKCCDQELAKAKCEIADYIEQLSKLKESSAALNDKLLKLEEKCEFLRSTNKDLKKEICEQQKQIASYIANIKEKDTKYHKVCENFQQLKVVSSITDNQISEISTLLENERQLIKIKEDKIHELSTEKCKKDGEISALKNELRSMHIAKEDSELKVSSLTKELEKENIKICKKQEKITKLEEKLFEERQNFLLHLSKLQLTQEQLNSLQMAQRDSLKQSENYEKEMVMLKEENTRILSDLFHSNESIKEFQNKLEEKCAKIEDLVKQILELKTNINEKEKSMAERQIKYETLIQQYKKLANYMQYKLEILEQKKKKTFASKLFGTHSQEHVPALLNSKIDHLTEQIGNSMKATNSEMTKQIVKSPLKSSESTNINDIETISEEYKPKSANMIPQHCFELTIDASTNVSNKCIVCQGVIIMRRPHWHCKECSECVHCKCRTENMNNSCNVEKNMNMLMTSITSSHNSDTIKGIDVCTNNNNGCSTAKINIFGDHMSMDQYSYEPKLDEIDDDVCNQESDNECMLIFRTAISDAENSPQMEVYCASEIDENILLFGCNTGLYAFNILTKALVHIVGLDAVTNIVMCHSLSKVLFIASNGNSLYQCDLRHLKSRCQANECLRPALEASLLDLPLNRNEGGTCNETWRFIAVSDMSNEPLDTVAIVATLLRIIILKYNIKQKKFIPIRSLDTAICVSSITFTRLTAIVASDKFFEIDLTTCATEEFVDVSDQNLAITTNFKPILAISIDSSEILLCYAERGIFVDEYGCRSRTSDISWLQTPINIQFVAPYLYVAYSNSVQVIRLNSSFTLPLALESRNDGKSLTSDNIEQSDPSFKQVEREFHEPILLCKSQDISMYILISNQLTGLQEIYVLNGLKMHEQKFNESSETVDSIFTVATADLITSDMESDAVVS